MHNTENFELGRYCKSLNPESKQIKEYFDTRNYNSLT